MASHIGPVIVVTFLMSTGCGQVTGAQHRRGGEGEAEEVKEEEEEGAGSLSLGATGWRKMAHTRNVN